MVRRLVDALQEEECDMDPSRAHWTDGGAAYAEWMLTTVENHQGATFVAETEAEAGAVIGLLSCWRAEDASDITVVPAARVHLYVSDLVVLPEWRGRGVAGALLVEAEAHGRKLGVGQMTIGVLAANGPALRAYAKAGFEGYEMLLRKTL